MVMDRIQAMMEACITRSRTFPPTILYNESWLLRLILDWFSAHKVANHPLDFLNEAHWFSEAALPSHFLKSPKGTKLAEGWSHADGVIGHFEVGKGHKIDLSFSPRGRQLLVLEAKMFSSLAARTSNVPYYDQAARNIACIAETLYRANRSPSELSRLGFYVLAPATQIDQAVFVREMSRDSIENTVERRVKEYTEIDARVKNDWYVNWFLPTLQQIVLVTLKWEEVIQDIEKYDSIYANSINTFYRQCVEFGKRSSTHT